MTKGHHIQKENCAYWLNKLKCCVIVPTYNNDKMLEQVIQDVTPYTSLSLSESRSHSLLMVVNDGSTDNTRAILNEHPEIMQVSYDLNEGKGIAMRRGFEYALEKGFEYAITLDSDGQHYAKDLTVFVEWLCNNKNGIAIGSRNMQQENVPSKSSFGNKFSSFWLWVETGIKLNDTQSGYRLYPIKKISKLNFITGRYEFEVEVLVKAAWNDIELTCLPIDVYYPPAEERISHFRPFWDFFRISVLNTYLCILAFFWFRPKMFIRKLKKKGLRASLRQVIFNSNESNEKKALSVAYGVFWGIFPLWGFQLACAVPTAALLRLNVPIVFFSANISIPPLIPPIIYLSFLTGAMFLGDNASEFGFTEINSIDAIQMNLFQYTLGAVLLAIFTALCFGLLSYFLLTWRRTIE